MPNVQKLALAIYYAGIQDADVFHLGTNFTQVSALMGL